MTYDEQDFSKFHYWEKVEKQGEYPILLEHAFCENNGIHAGDELTAKLGDEERTCTVYGVVSRPETLSTPSIGGMKVTSMDICYMYVPAAILADEENPEYVKALAEWNQKNREYEDAKNKADSEHEKAREEIEDSEKKLSEAEKELNGKLTEAEQQKASLLRNRQELSKKQQELNELEQQIRTKKKELSEGEKKLTQERQNLNASKSELSKKREELDKLKKDLETNYAELKAKLETGRSSLEESKKTVEKWKKFIRVFEENMNRIQKITYDVELPEDTYEAASELVSDVDRILSDTDFVIEILKSFDKVIQGVKVDNLPEEMEEYAITLKKLRDDLSNAVEKAEDPAKIEALRTKIISTSRFFLDNFVKNSKTVAGIVDSATTYVQDAEKKIEEGSKQL